MANPKDQHVDSSMVDALDQTHGRSTLALVFQGMLLPLRAFRFLIKHPPLWLYVIIPALINIGLFVGGLWVVFSYAGVILELIWIEPAVEEGWYHWLVTGIWHVLVTLVAVLTVLASYIFMLLVGGIIASPFNDALSRRVEARILPEHQRREPASSSMIWETLRAIGSSIFILGSYCVIMVPILFLNLVPVIGQAAATFLGAGISSLFLAMEFTDAPLDRRGHGLRRKFELIEGNRAISLGFGLGSSLLLWIPFLNFLTIPIAAVGGTALGIVLVDWERREHTTGDTDMSIERDLSV